MTRENTVVKTQSVYVYNLNNEPRCKFNTKRTMIRQEFCYKLNKKQKKK